MQRAREAAASAEAQPLDYQAAAALAYAISALHKSVESRPKSAAAFAVGNSIFLPWLLRCSLQWDSTQAALGLETFHMILGCAEASSRSAGPCCFGRLSTLQTNKQTRMQACSTYS